MKTEAIEFESSAKYITAFAEGGKVIIRCDFDLTDCGDEEALPDFVRRHGGMAAATEYLVDCYRGS